MVTGCLPFADGSAVEIITARLKGEPPPPRAHAPHISLQIDATITRAMSREPQDRFPAVGDFVAALQRLADPATASTYAQVIDVVDRRGQIRLG